MVATGWLSRGAQLWVPEDADTADKPGRSHPVCKDPGQRHKEEERDGL